MQDCAGVTVHTSKHLVTLFSTSGGKKHEQANQSLYICVQYSIRQPIDMPFCIQQTLWAVGLCFMAVALPLPFIAELCKRKGKSLKKIQILKKCLPQKTALWSQTESQKEGSTILSGTV